MTRLCVCAVGVTVANVPILCAEIVIAKHVIITERAIVFTIGSGFIKIGFR